MAVMLAGGISVPVAAIIAAIASVAVAGVSWLTQRQMAGRAERQAAQMAGRAERQAARLARVDRLTEQLSQLYGPLRLLTMQSKALAEKLRQGKTNPDKWALLDNLTEVVQSDADRPIAEQIIAVNGEIEKIIFAHAGLIENGDIPESFVRFLGHYRLLSIAFAAAQERKETPREITAKQFEHYPREFDSDVERVYDQLRVERQKLLSA